MYVQLSLSIIYCVHNIRNVEMIIKEIKGNVFADFEKSLYDILVHGSNCWHVMGVIF